MTRILVTGAAGNVGQAFLDALEGSGHTVTATDIREPDNLPAGIAFRTLDVRGDDPGEVIGAQKPEVVVHLASVVSPPKNAPPNFEYDVDVTGTRNVLDACLAHGVRRIVVTSSGAAYGYHPDNPVPLTETGRLRGNEEFVYSRHKRLVEEMLARTRQSAPRLEQVVLRVGTVLGPGLENQITALFHRRRLLAIRGSSSPFVFIATDDLAHILLHASTDGPPGIYNVAGDGTVDMHRIGEILGKPVIDLPAWLLKAALGIARPLGLSRYGPEQVGFLQYRPVLDNTALKSTFGYTPALSSEQAFDQWRRTAGL